MTVAQVTKREGRARNGHPDFLVGENAPEFAFDLFGGGSSQKTSKELRCVQYKQK
jgi:hypothetical protein